eukprot:5385009-Amphidinium_carterae.1
MAAQLCACHGIALTQNSDTNCLRVERCVSVLPVWSWISDMVHTHSSTKHAHTVHVAMAATLTARHALMLTLCQPTSLQGKFRDAMSTASRMSR